MTSPLKPGSNPKPGISPQPRTETSNGSKTFLLASGRAANSKQQPSPPDAYSSERVACRNSRVAAHQPVESFQSYRLGLHSTMPLLKRSAVSS